MAVKKGPAHFPDIAGLRPGAAKNLIFKRILAVDPESPFSVSLHAIFSEKKIVPTVVEHGCTYRLHFSREGSTLWAEADVDSSRDYGSSSPSACLGTAKLQIQGTDVRWRACSLTADGTVLAQKIDELLTLQQEADCTHRVHSDLGERALAKLKAMVDAAGHQFRFMEGTIQKNYRDNVPTAVTVVLSQAPSTSLHTPPVKIHAAINGEDVTITSIVINTGATYDLAALLNLIR